jgi:DNA recombination protein RmuC
MSGPTLNTTLLIMQILLFIAVISIAYLSLKHTRGGSLDEKIQSHAEEIEGSIDTKLTATRQELENKIGQVGDNVVTWLGKQNTAFIEGIDKMSDSVNKGLADGRKEQDERLRTSSEQVDKRIAEAINEINRRLESNVEVIQKANKDFSDRIDASTKVFSDVKQELGKIEEAQRKVREVGLQVEELANILQAPKARGGFGEALLADFLMQHLPVEHYELQYGFADGQKVDAVIKLTGGIVPIDAKFPLENFRKLISSKEGDDIQKGAKVRFRNDVKKHVDDIARKYIRPTEGTFEFAFMYVPAENVYYEMVTASFEGDRPLSDYAIGKRVIPVSPNNFFAYLMTVAMGLKGMQLEERTKEVLAKLSHMGHEMCGIMETYTVLGTHLKNAAGKYTETNKRLEKFSTGLESLTAGTGDDGKAITDGSDSTETKAITNGDNILNT